MPQDAAYRRYTEQIIKEKAQAVNEVWVDLYIRIVYTL